jgi:hypothetical protein
VAADLTLAVVQGQVVQAVALATRITQANALVQQARKEVRVDLFQPMAVREHLPQAVVARVDLVRA